MRMTPAIPILTYHSIHVDGDGYAMNDHIGLAEDLALLHSLGWRVIGLNRLVQAVVSGDWSDLPEHAVVITLDDGSWFDWYDLPHPEFGQQRSMANLLRDFQTRHGSNAQPHLQATSFVIGSPAARDALDKNCMIGRGWWRDDWWREAHAEGLLQIANHSWDHRHAAIPDALRYKPEFEYGDFEQLADEQECDWQIRQTQDYLRVTLAAAPPQVFAYPYGQVPAIVADEYLPKYGPGMGLQAAVTTQPAMVTKDCNRWRMPRYVFRRDWQCVAGLRQLLADSD
jgi:hypothetical protein